MNIPSLRNFQFSGHFRTVHALNYKLYTLYIDGNICISFNLYDSSSKSKLYFLEFSLLELPARLFIRVSLSCMVQNFRHLLPTPTPPNVKTAICELVNKPIQIISKESYIYIQTLKADCILKVSSQHKVHDNTPAGIFFTFSVETGICCNKIKG